MPVIGVPKDRLIRIVEHTNTLRPGQIVQGKILKIYPNNRAELQIGSQRMVAQLEAPLVVGERYHFQVANTKDVVELKVIGTNLKNASLQNATQLLNDLNIKTTRPTVQFVQMLINEKMPFTKAELQQAIQLLERSNGSSDAQRVLFEMIGRHLPITDAVFNALFVKRLSTISSQFTSLMKVLQNSQGSSEANQQLLNQLLQLTNGKFATENSVVQLLQNYIYQGNIDSFLSQLLQNQSQIVEQMQRLLNLLPNDSSLLTPYNVERAKIIINQMQTSNDVKQLLLSMLQHDKSQFLNLVRSFSNPNTFGQLNSYLSNESIQQQFLTHINEFIQLSGLTYEHTANEKILNLMPVNIENILTQLTLQKEQIQQQVRSFLNRWLHFYSNNNIQSMSKEEQTLFKQQVQNDVIRLLPQEQRQAVLNVLQQNDSVERVWQLLQTLSRHETFEQINTTLTQLNANKINVNMTNQLSEVRGLLQSLQIPFASSIHNDVSEQLQQTIKGQLLQLIQQNDTSLGERAQQVVHFINGLQIHSVHETNHFIQASIQVPGERIGLNSDLYMDFESRKTEDGKIDPNYCRILFFLNLASLKDTVIDMHVQKRLVTLTVYNDHEIEHLSRPFYKPLRDGLEKLDYQLSTIRFKRLIERTKQTTEATSQMFHSEEQKHGGVDFRI